MTVPGPPTVPVAAPEPVSTARSAAMVLRRAAAAEWTRLRTLRSTWWILSVATVLMTFIAGVAGSQHDGPEPAPIWVPAQIAIAPGQLAFLLLVLLAVTAEYATGAIRSSLQWVPQRGVLLVARTLVPVAFATACAVLIAAGANLVAWGFVGQGAEIVPADVAASLGRIALVVAFGGALSVGIGLLLRSTAGALTTLFLLIFVLPVALGNTGVRWLVTISDALPGRAIVSLILVGEGGLSTRAVATVMILWTLAALLAGGWSFLRRAI